MAETYFVRSEYKALGPVWAGLAWADGTKFRVLVFANSEQEIQEGLRKACSQVQEDVDALLCVEDLPDFTPNSSVGSTIPLLPGDPEPRYKQ